MIRDDTNQHYAINVKWLWQIVMTVSYFWQHHYSRIQSVICSRPSVDCGWHYGISVPAKPTNVCYCSNQNNMAFLVYFDHLLNSITNGCLWITFCRQFHKCRPQSFMLNWELFYSAVYGTFSLWKCYIHLVEHLLSTGWVPENKSHILLPCGY